MKINVFVFGEVEGEVINVFMLINDNGMLVILFNYGGIIKEIYFLNVEGELVSCV